MARARVLSPLGHAPVARCVTWSVHVGFLSSRAAAAIIPSGDVLEDLARALAAHLPLPVLMARSLVVTIK
eukprot:11061368-Lingulodinium_polyedra.AAC.1